MFFRGMNKLRGTATFLLVWFILSPRILSAVGDGGHQEEKPSLMGIARSIFSFTTTSPVSSWDKLKPLINQVQMYLFPPNIDFRRNDEAETGGERMKEAVEKSVETSKATIEETAKSAAKVVGEAMHKTAEKVKGSESETAGDAEL
ncbi:hypothetical protein HHK36_004126 [Tetracentron sinense]|uniref:Uncharacterized protein n=1 Tax=Tetracentron sinense TaxID=13715 RepID=A0A835DPZ5_TETSI|nr:hypothetical protein HHK36_004126 [Tetracentron sinense]